MLSTKFTSNIDVGRWISTAWRLTVGPLVFWLAGKQGFIFKVQYINTIIFFVFSSSVLPRLGAMIMCWDYFENKFICLPTL